jgi:hypothetical protein
MGPRVTPSGRPKDKLRAIRGGPIGAQGCPRISLALHPGSLKRSRRYSAAVTVLAGTFAPAP